MELLAVLPLILAGAAVIGLLILARVFAEAPRRDPDHPGTGEDEGNHQQRKGTGSDHGEKGASWSVPYSPHEATGSEG